MTQVPKLSLRSTVLFSHLSKIVKYLNQISNGFQTVQESWDRRLSLGFHVLSSQVHTQQCLFISQVLVAISLPVPW